MPGLPRQPKLLSFKLALFCSMLINIILLVTFYFIAAAPIVEESLPRVSCSTKEDTNPLHYVENKTAGTVKEIAVMIVGTTQIYGISIWRSIQSQVIKPIQGHYVGAQVDIFFCSTNTKEDIALRNKITLSNSTLMHRMAIKFWVFDVVEIPDVRPQFARIKKCYERIEEYRQDSEHDQQHYDIIIKTRPDLMWFESIPLPFSTKHVMGRARMAPGMKVTRAQLAYPLDCGTPEGMKVGCRDGTCIMVDDQLAVVPRVHQEAYFRFLGVGIPQVQKKIGGIVVATSNNVWPTFELLGNDSCPCWGSGIHWQNGTKTWPEGKFTNHLASLDVSYTLTPFSVRLTEKGGDGFRWGGFQNDFHETIHCRV